MVLFGGVWGEVKKVCCLGVDFVFEIKLLFFCVVEVLYFVCGGVGF